MIKFSLSFLSFFLFLSLFFVLYGFNYTQYIIKAAITISKNYHYIKLIGLNSELKQLDQIWSFNI